MNSRRSYFDSINSGRRRRPTTSLEQLNRTLEELEGRIEHVHSAKGERYGPDDRGGSRQYRDEPDAWAESRSAPRAEARPRPDSAPRGGHRDLAREIEEQRTREGSLRSMGRIAGELDGLRRELREQVGGDLRQEFAALRQEIEAAFHAARPSEQVGELAAEFERLAAMIHKMSMRGDDRQVDLLRKEMEEVKQSLGMLAREDTVRSVDRRWEDFDRRWEVFTDRLGETVRQRQPDPALAGLQARLEQIGEAVNALPTSTSMRSLEDKLKVLSLAVDQFAHQQDRIGPEALDAIEFRLDEISRAIASAAAPPPALPFDPQAIDRIEARISALARQIGELAEERPAGALAEQMAALGARVEDMGARADLPRQAVERLGQQIAGIGRKLDEAPALPDVDRMVGDLQDRFQQLSEMLDRRHGDTLHQGHALYRELEKRLDEMARGMDRKIEALPAVGREIVGTLDARFAELAQRLEARPAPGTKVGPELLEAMDARFADLGRRIEANGAPVQGVSPDILEALDARLSEIKGRLDARQEPQADPAPRLIGALEARFDEFARRIASQPSATADAALIGRLDARLADIAGRIATGPDSVERVGAELRQTFEKRMADLAGRIDRRPAAAAGPSPELLDAIDSRFERLAERLETNAPAAIDEGAIRSIAERLDAISHRIEDAARQPLTGDGDLIRSLEAQVAALSQQISRPSEPIPAVEDLGPRLDDIERSILEGRHDVIEAARRAAEDAVRSFAGSSGDKLLVAALADDLKSLEDLARRSDDRNARTFEAIHDTLLKIVDRLGAMETHAPAPRHVDNDLPPVLDTPLPPRQTSRPRVPEMPEPVPPQVAKAPQPEVRTQAAPARASEPEANEDRAAARARKLGLKGTPSIDPPLEALTPPIHEADEEPSDAPSPVMTVRTPATAARQAAAEAVKSGDEAPPAKAAGRLSVLGSLTRAITSRKAKPKAEAEPIQPPRQPRAPGPEVDLDRPLDPVLANQPIEPGAGAPDLNAIMRRVRDERGQAGRPSDPDAAKSDFIAAARRAAQAAAAEAEMMKRGPAKKPAESRFNFGKLLKGRSKPVMLGIAAVLIAIAGLQIGRQFLMPQATPVALEMPAAAVVEPIVENAQVRMVRPVENAQARLLAPAIGTDEAQRGLTTGGAQARNPASFTAATLPDELEGNEDWLAADGADGFDTDEMAAEGAALPVFALPAIDVPENAGPAPLREAAAAGDAKALFEIGNRYAEGRGMPVDMVAAARWYEQAAEFGLAPAQYRIGNLHEKGIGVERDIDAAKTWYQLAAAQGNASAMHNLAVLYAMGADGTADNESAARWFLEAAELGVRDSQFNLGILAARGVGMPQNLIEAYKWFALVSQAGDGDAGEKRDEIARALRPEQLERARAAADLWQAQPLDPDANMVEIPDEWMEADMPTASVDMKQAVRNIQAILNSLGYDAGTPDGIMGARTKAAIAAFQGANGMPATGEIDEPLVRTLLEKRQAAQAG